MSKKEDKSWVLKIIYLALFGEKEIKKKDKKKG